MAVKIICCYSHEDEVLLNKLKAHLRPLEREGLIEVWHDRDISAGTDWEKEISEHLNSAQIILLLVSPDFMDSEYCYGIEMKRAIERHQRGEARVIPIIIRHVYWQGEPLGKLQALPRDANPVTSASWHTLDEAFFDVVRGIREVIRTLLTQTIETDQEIKEQRQETTEQTLSAQLQRQTINTDEAVNLFHHLMRPTSKMRILRLVGDGKMGKSHLLTKVFPSLIQQGYQARYAILDLRNRLHTVPDILHMTCGQLGTKNCDGYYAAHQALINRPKLGVEPIRALLSFFSISPKVSSDDTHYRNRHLTAWFVNDLGKLDDKLLLLLFDSVNNATESLQTWLMDTFLVQVSPLAHVRVIVAGRSFSEPHGSYTTLSRSYQLLPVREESEYIAFYRSLNVKLTEQSINHH